MISEIGTILLSIAASLSFATILLSFLKSDLKFISLMGRYLIGANFIIVLISFFVLAYAFLISDFSIMYVANNSNLSLPWYYKFSAVWGGHEGSMLLWVLILTVWSYLSSKYSHPLSEQIIININSVMAFLIFAFLFFILFTSNPFESLLPAPLNGRDLNPLLQDPGLVIHPPMLYLGYVGTAIPFAFSIAILFRKETKSIYFLWLRKWVLASWLFLTAGIALGSWWAYHELGWGGWWFWDPVENASFMPWLILTALLHSLIVSEKRGVFKSWTIFLAVLTFGLSLLGTFLVRSGVLVSVHAFANDPARGIFILAFLGIVLGLSLVLYFFNSNNLEDDSSYEITSKEFMLLLNNILLTITTFAVLLGTLYPLFTSILDIGKISVGPPYFNYISTFIILPLVFIMTPGILSNWRKTDFSKIYKRSVIYIIFSFILSILILKIFYDTNLLITITALAIAFFTVIGSLIKLSQAIKIKFSQTKSFMKSIFIKNSILSNSIAHIGVGLMLVGVVISSNFSDHKELVLNYGDSITIADRKINFVGIKNVKAVNYFSKTGVFESFNQDNYEITFYPEKRIYSDQQNIMTEAAIHSTLFRDIYIALGEQITSNSWSVRIYHKPLMQFIWLGAILMVISAIFGVLSRNKRE